MSFLAVISHKVTPDHSISASNLISGFGPWATESVLDTVFFCGKYSMVGGQILPVHWQAAGAQVAVIVSRAHEKVREEISFIPKLWSSYDNNFWVTQK